MLSKEERMLHWEIQRGQIRKANPLVPIRVRTTSRTRYQGPKVILPMGGISQDTKKQDSNLVMSKEESMDGNNCFMTTGRSNEYVKECARHQANHIVSYFLVTKI